MALPEELLEKLKNYLINKHAPVAHDINLNNQALDLANGIVPPEVQPSSGTATGYSQGGIVDKLKSVGEHIRQKVTNQKNEGYGNLKGFENLIRKQQGFDVNASSNTPTSYAKGGIVNDNTSGNDFLSNLQTGSVPSLQFNPKAGLPPEPAPTMPLQSPQMPVQAPNPVNQYLDTQKANLGKYGPEEQIAVNQSIAKNRGSFASKAPVALGGLADAIMQGVGRTGSPGFMSQIQGQQNLQDTNLRDTYEKAQSQNLARSGAEMKLDELDPRSPLSQAAQKEWGGLLAQNGFRPEQISQMSASHIAAITGQTVEALKAKAEAEMARASLGLNTQKAAEEARHQRETEGIAKSGLSQAEQEKELARREGALRAVSGRSILQRAGDFIIPNPATKELEKEAGLQGPTVQSPTAGWKYLGPKQ